MMGEGLLAKEGFNFQIRSSEKLTQINKLLDRVQTLPDFKSLAAAFFDIWVGPRRMS